VIDQQLSGFLFATFMSSSLCSFSPACCSIGSVISCSSSSSILVAIHHIDLRSS
jgi:hypothetical protein